MLCEKLRSPAAQPCFYLLDAGEVLCTRHCVCLHVFVFPLHTDMYVSLENLCLEQSCSCLLQLLLNILGKNGLSRFSCLIHKHYKRGFSSMQCILFSVCLPVKYFGVAALVDFSVLFPRLFCLLNNSSWQRRTEHFPKCSHDPQVRSTAL